MPLPWQLVRAIDDEVDDACAYGERIERGPAAAAIPINAVEIGYRLWPRTLVRGHCIRALGFLSWMRAQAADTIAGRASIEVAVS